MNSRIILVSGGNDGIGFEICRLLASKGHTVLLGARDQTKGSTASDTLNKEINSNNVHFIQLDITNDDSVKTAVTTIKEKFGKIDSLVNNAGVGNLDKIPLQKPSTCDLDLVRSTFETNFFGSVRVTTAMIPLMHESLVPVIVFVSTDMASTTNQAKPGSHLNIAGYNPSKAAVNSYAVALANDLPNFRINCVTPGYTATKLNAFGKAMPGAKTTQSAAEALSKYILLEKDGPTCKFFNSNHEEFPF